MNVKTEQTPIEAEANATENVTAAIEQAIEANPDANESEIKSWLEKSLISPISQTMENLNEQIAALMEQTKNQGRMISEMRANQTPQQPQAPSQSEQPTLSAGQETLANDTQETATETSLETKTEPHEKRPVENPSQMAESQTQPEAPSQKRQRTVTKI